MPHLPPPRLPIRFRVVTHAHLELSASNVVSVRHLASLGVMLPAATPIEYRRLPLHGSLPPRSCPRLVLISYELSIWYDDLQRNTGIKHRGLAPHKLTPMLGVREPERRSQADLKWTINRRRPVTADVRDDIVVC